MCTLIPFERSGTVVNGNPRFGNRVTCQISRNGDLIHRVYLVVNSFPTVAGHYVEYPGLKLIKNIDLEIGGQRIDRHYAEWMYIWNELSLPSGKQAGYKTMVGQVDSSSSAITNDYQGGSTLHIPLEFWFCRNIGLALKLGHKSTPRACYSRDRRGKIGRWPCSQIPLVLVSRPAREATGPNCAKPLKLLKGHWS